MKTMLRIMLLIPVLFGYGSKAIGGDITNSFSTVLAKTVLIGVPSNNINVGVSLMTLTGMPDRVSGIEVNTSLWNQASVNAINATGRVDILEKRTSTWNQAVSDVQTLQNQTSNWNTAYSLSTDLTNRMSSVEGLTSVWNNASDQLSNHVEDSSVHFMNGEKVGITGSVATINASTITVNGNTHSVTGSPSFTVPIGISGPYVRTVNGESNDVFAATTNQGAKADTAWQNSSSFTNFTWVVVDGNSVTLTGCSAIDAVIPDMIDGLPVTRIGSYFGNVGLVSVSGGKNIAFLDTKAFYNCRNLKSVSLTGLIGIGESAFELCFALELIDVGIGLEFIEGYAFSRCFSLGSIKLGDVESIGDYAFESCHNLTEIYYTGNAPVVGLDIFYDAPVVMNYVLRAEAYGWGDTLGGMPVVRSTIYGDGSNLTGITATQVGALQPSDTNGWTVGSHEMFLTNELDLAASRFYHYGSPDVIESPTNWFMFDGAGTIIGFNYEAGRTNVVVPWQIDSVAVTSIYEYVFMALPINSLVCPDTVMSIRKGAFQSCGLLASCAMPSVTSIGSHAFSLCYSLTSLSLPSINSIGDFAFTDCKILTSVYFSGNAPTIGTNIYGGSLAVTNYITSVTANGWGEKLGGMPVVRLPLYGDKIYQAGELVATTGYVAQASLADADGYTTQMVMRVGSEIATNRWGPRVTLPDGVLTNGAEHVEFGASSPFSGYPNFNPPDSALSIFAPAKFIYVDSNVGGFWGIKFRGTGGGGFTDIFGFTANGATGEIQLGSRWPTYYMSLMSGGETRVTLKKDGKVGIGTTNPSEIFEVVGSCKSSGTNTAAEVRSLGGYSIFDSGSNCYWRVTASNGTFYASDTNGVRKFKFTTETPYTAWTGTITPANGTATVSIAHGNMPVLVTDAPCVLTLDPTGYGTGGVSRVSLSYYPGTNSFTFATNIIKYAETPTVVTNGWNTLLIRRVSNGAWKGVGL